MGVEPISVASGDLDYEQLLARTRQQMFQIQALSARLARINDLTAAISSTFDLDIILHRVGEHVPNLITCAHCSLTLLEDGGWKQWLLLAGDGDLQSVLLGDEPALNYSMETGSARLVNQNRAPGLFAEYASYLIVPLPGEPRPAGTLNFAEKDPQAFSIEDVQIARLIAFQLGAALRNADRYHELRRTQEALSRHAEELEARNQELDAYNQIIAHDLKAPLNAVYGYASLLSLFSPEEYGESGAQYVKQIMDSAQQMNSMIQQLLWLAQTPDAPMQQVDVSAVLDRVALRFEHQLAARSIRLEIARDIPPAIGHEAWIEEMFANLVGNAIKYMGNDPNPLVQVRGVRQGAFNRYEVQDNGIGIEPEHLKSVFQMFARVTPGAVEGHGLGLSIVARLAKKLGGEAGVESTPGRGSTFWISLPAE
ncbi:MAG: GAF domain-containing sensor histidine kinase [Anaerolinea sp.]|nr:GAF domain-containing sensor histidine kinase [Anaerolinea sp.]